MPTTDWLQQPGTTRKRLIFARHGEYAGNLARTANCDPGTPSPLTLHGQQQAAALALRLQDERIEAIVCSQFQRARETAWWISKALDLPVLVNRLANENQVGLALEGRPTQAFQDFIAADPAHTAAIDGESFVAMKSRLRRLIHDLQHSSPSTILVVTHGWPIQAVRVLQGVLSDEEGARCKDMPGNCETVLLMPDQDVCWLA